LTDSTIEQVKFEEAMGIVGKFIHFGRMEEVADKLPAGCVDHMFCDPPYAIEMSNLAQEGNGQADIDRIADTHDVEENLGDIPKWLRACWRMTKDKGYVVWFCDAMVFKYIHDEAVKVGFKVQRWPLTWVKTSSCMNQRAEFNTTKNTEIAIVMRKPGAKLVMAQPTSVFIGQLSPEDKAACPNHPFIKPRELWQWLFKMIALPGATIGDGFSGVGSMTRAALLDGYTPLTIECDEKHYHAQLINTANTYLSL
jgi:DNA modification methylase